MGNGIGPVERGSIADVDLLLSIDRRADAAVGAAADAEAHTTTVAPIHEQLEQALREHIRAGRLPAGARLPSSRALAARLGVSRGVVSEAYGQLAAEGYLTTRQGAAVRVSSAVRTQERRAQAHSLLPSFAYDMRPTVPDLAGFPHDRWLRSIKAALRESSHSAIGYPDPRGAPELRAALAEYLGRVRGVAADPEHMLVCTGFTQGLSLLCRELAAQGVSTIALEDPCWHSQRVTIEQAGLQVEPVPVDAEGIDVNALSQSSAPAVIVTPAHQFPTGTVLSPSRRAALIEWAESGERLIVEDDYDGELRFDRGAVGALQGLAPERVVYAGSASKRLAPAMRLGWLQLPSWLTWNMSAAKAAEDGGSETIGQLALADFIARGELDRHLRRMRAVYEQRREALLAGLSRHLPQARATGGPCGLFEPVELPEEVDEHALLERAATQRLGLEGLSLHRFHDRGRSGLVLGYGTLSEPAIERGLRLLAEVFRHLDDHGTAGSLARA